MMICEMIRIFESHLQLLSIPQLPWINLKRAPMNDEDGNTRSTRRNGMQTQRLCQTGEHSFCMITDIRGLRQMDFDRLEEGEVGADLELGVPLHLQSMCAHHLLAVVFANQMQSNAPSL